MMSNEWDQSNVWDPIAKIVYLLNLIGKELQKTMKTTTTTTKQTKTQFKMRLYL
jgi:hypothetical protein